MISVAMLVKNEALTIVETINSVRAYADEVVVGLDEDSSDGTREILAEQKLADTVIPTQLTKELEKKGSVKEDGSDWGFSRARNIVLEACKPENWRLIMDGHEIIQHPENLQKIVEYAKSLNADGVELVLDFEPDAYGVPQLSYRQVRLMSPTVRYQNPIHNIPLAKVVVFSDASKVIHQKKKQNVVDKMARDVQRADANIVGLKKKVEDNPKDTRSWFYLGIAYRESNQWKEAIPAFEEYLKLSRWNEERWHARVYMASCYSCLGDADNARKHFSLAIDEFPLMAEGYYYMGDLAYKQNRYREAQLWLEKACLMPEPSVKLFLTPKIYRMDRYDALAMVYHHLRMWAEAIVYGEKALSAYGGKNDRLENNIRIWKEQLKPPQPMSVVVPAGFTGGTL